MADKDKGHRGKNYSADNVFQARVKQQDKFTALQGEYFDQGAIHTSALILFEPLTTFSPCNAGTDSRRLVKLSLMWSLRFLSNAL
jgi:hypothetical protein